ncbi:MAG: helix-turn-helix domain-containing protein, partial [Burkholderiaceae bacterium]
RADLYYRLAVIELWVPSLDERGAEEKKTLFRTLLARHWQSGIEAESGDDVPVWLLDRIAMTSYPGNVRELSNVVERIALVRRQLGVWDERRIERIFERLKAAPCASSDIVATTAPEMTPLGNAERAERARVLSALQANGWRRQDTAQQLGISRKVLWEKMRKLQLNPGQAEMADDSYATSS